MTPSLTFLVPTFERASHLERLLDVLARELSGFDGVAVLVADNASSDATSDVLERALPLLPGLRVHRQPENVGPLENVRWLMSNAPPTDYVWCMGDDDAPVEGGVAEVLRLLAEHRPRWLHLPHGWVDERGVTVSESPCPERVEEFADGADLYRAYHHWLTFLSASVLATEAARKAAVETPTENRYAPLVWFFLAGLGGRCLVADRRLVRGGADISWGALRASIVTRHYVGLYDAALGRALSTADFASGLDRLYVDDSFLAFWREGGPLDDLVAAVQRFPEAVSLRWYLWVLAREAGRVDALEALDDAARDAGADEAAREVVSKGEERFAAGDAQGAAVLFSSALRLLPTLAAAWNDLGVALHALAREDALDAFAIAVALDPDDPDALLNRALAALERGDSATAAGDARRLLELDPDNAEAARIVQAAKR
jgi:tetratricopeptide (TPR) repeat protein